MIRGKLDSVNMVMEFHHENEENEFSCEYEIWSKKMKKKKYRILK